MMSVAFVMNNCREYTFASLEQRRRRRHAG